jgi:hypothetical protein
MNPNFQIEELKNGTCILVDKYGDILLTKPFPSYNLATHFLSYYTAENDLEESYKEWKKLFFIDGNVSEKTFRHDSLIISTLTDYFNSLDDTIIRTISDTDKEIAKIGACGFVTFCLNHGFIIKRVDEE